MSQYGGQAAARNEGALLKPRTKASGLQCIPLNFAKVFTSTKEAMHFINVRFPWVKSPAKVFTATMTNHALLLDKSKADQPQ